MALIKCPECGKEISDMAKSCPNCGFPINRDKTGDYIEKVEGVIKKGISNIESTTTFVKDKADKISTEYKINKNSEDRIKTKIVSINKKKIGIVCAVVVFIIMLVVLINMNSLKDTIWHLPSNIDYSDPNFIDRYHLFVPGDELWFKDGTTLLMDGKTYNYYISGGEITISNQWGTDTYTFRIDNDGYRHLYLDGGWEYFNGRDNWVRETWNKIEESLIYIVYVGIIVIGAIFVRKSFRDS